MALSSFFSDEDVVSQLRGFFDCEEQWTIDFQSLLSQVEEYDEEYFQLRVKDRSFLVDRVTGEVLEVTV